LRGPQSPFNLIEEGLVQLAKKLTGKDQITGRSVELRVLKEVYLTRHHYGVALARRRGAERPSGAGEGRLVTLTGGVSPALDIPDIAYVRGHFKEVLKVRGLRKDFQSHQLVNEKQDTSEFSIIHVRARDRWHIIDRARRLSVRHHCLASHAVKVDLCIASVDSFLKRHLYKWA